MTLSVWSRVARRGASKRRIISAGNEELVERTDVGNPLGLLKSGDAALPLVRCKIDNLDGTLLQAGDKKPLALNVYIHVIEPAGYARQWDGLDEAKLIRSLGNGESRQERSSNYERAETTRDLQSSPSSSGIGPTGANRFYTS